MRRSGKNQGDELLKKDEFDLSSTAPAAVAMDYAQDEEFKVKEELQEEDPFAFDFDTDEDPEDMEHFDSFDSGITPIDEPDTIVDDMDFLEDPETELESAIEEETDLDEDFSSFDEADDLPEPEINLDADDFEEFVEDDIPTMTPETVETESSELEPELESAESESNVSSEAEKEEESFVSSLLNDVDQEDVDESAIFNGIADDSIASTIEETLAEVQESEEEFDVPAFGEAEAAVDEEGSDDEEEFDFFDASGDEVATKLDLARAYMDMGDEEGARVILEDVVQSGNEKQISEAQNMIERMFPSD